VSATCQSGSPAANRKQFARDQLRLDVAVAKDELYSWHGENNFSSKQISDIVETGPISSGGFVGYLQNIFLGAGIRFTYAGISSSPGKEYKFTFSVPKTSSQYSILTGTKFEVVPFHGSFSARADNFELLSLTVIPEEIPFGSNICSVETEVNYRLAPISGHSALIPDSFDLRIDDDQHQYTVSRGQYRECHEFRAESALRFDYSDSSSGGAVTSTTVQEHLPPGIKMRLSLAAALDDETSYAGDPVDAILVDPVRVPGTGEVIPRGTRTHGVITGFESRFEPSDHFFLKIVFERISYGNRTYSFYAVHKPSGKEMDKITSLFGGILPKAIMAQLTGGVIIIPGKHVHLDQRYKGEWETAAAPSIRNDEIQSAK
jgi:hypothetical protein